MEKSNVVIEYVKEYLSISDKDINEKTTLSDLGLDGDDVLDFLIDFFEKFNIEYKNTNYMDFIPPERGYFMFGILNIFSVNKNEYTNNEIFIKDLLVSLNKKRWTKK